MQTIDRRKFVTTASGGLLGVSALASAATGVSEKVPRIKLGRAKLEVPRLAVGSTREVTRPVLAYCLQQGANWIDTAPNYVQYRSEELLGKLFKSMRIERKDLILSSKTKNRTPAQWPEMVAASCKRLGVDRLDILYAHSIGGRTRDRPSDSPDWLLKPEVARAVADLKRSGRIRAFGYTCHLSNREFVNELIRKSSQAAHVDLLMVRYNFRDLGDREFAESLAIARKAGQGVVAMKTQGGAKATPEKLEPFLDRGFSHWQAAIGWAASDPSVHTVCANLLTLEMAKENMAAIKKPRLSAGDFEQLMLYAKATSTKACRACGRCAGACPRGIAVPDINRALMYHDDYGDADKARQTYAGIPLRMRAGKCGGCEACRLACPHGLAVGAHIARAGRLFEKA